MCRRFLVLMLVIAGMMASAPPGIAGQDRDQPADLAAMPVLPGDLPEPGYQLARGGYLTVEDTRFLIGGGHDLESGVMDEALTSSSGTQGYTQSLVLLEDRSYRTSTALAAIETMILGFEDEDGAELVAALITGSPPEDAESREPAVEGAVTWRTVTSQDDRLVTVARSGRFVFEIVSADATGTPDATRHAELVQSTLDRARMVIEGDAYGLSKQIVSLDGSRLIPIAIDAEAPLVHSYYRLIDDQVTPVAGELPAPTMDAIPNGAEQIVISRQTAELASQNWLTAGVVVIAFDDGAIASDFAEGGVYRDPLDIFAVDETAESATSLNDGLRVESLSGESRVDARYSGYRVTVTNGATVAQLTVRVIGNTQLDQHGVEMWALTQRECLSGGACQPAELSSLLATPDPATPIAGEVDDGLYQSPVAPWSVSFEPATWRVADTLAESGYDYLYLRSERMDAKFETIVDQHGDPEQCVLNELDRLREVEDRANITLGSDDPGESPGGLEPGHGWVIYTIEPLEGARSAEEYTLRIDCYTVIEGSTSLVVQVRAPRDAWPGISARGEALRAGIVIDGVSARRTGPAQAGSLHAPVTVFQTPGRVVMVTWTPWTGIAA